MPLSILLPEDLYRLLSMNRITNKHLCGRLGKRNIRQPENTPLERFYSQNKNSAEGGTGIGLFLTKRLVEIHNGNITFVSEEGKGTVFHVVIPMITEGDMVTENISAEHWGG